MCLFRPRRRRSRFPGIAASESDPDLPARALRLPSEKDSRALPASWSRSPASKGMPLLDDHDVLIPIALVPILGRCKPRKGNWQAAYADMEAREIRLGRRPIKRNTRPCRKTILIQKICTIVSCRRKLRADRGERPTCTRSNLRERADLVDHLKGEGVALER